PEECRDDRRPTSVPRSERVHAPHEHEPHFRADVLDVLRLRARSEAQPHLRRDERLEVRDEPGQALALALRRALRVERGQVHRTDEDRTPPSLQRTRRLASETRLARMELVLVHPEIPHNTGCAARLSAALGLRLHLVEPLGFSLEDRYLKRAGLDYWPMVDLVVHRSWSELVRTLDASSARPIGQRVHMFTARGGCSLFETRFEP